MANEGQEKPKTVEERLAAVEEAVGTILDLVEAQAKKIAEVDKKAVKKSTGLFGGKRTKTAIKDIKTGTIYASKAQMGKKLAGEFSLDAGNNFVYYQIIAKAPERFVEASAEETQKVWAEEAAQVEKERQVAQTKLDAEGKAETEAKAGTETKPKAKK